MRILLAAGSKTGNIATPLESRFASGAVVINSEKDIDGIMAYIQKGEVFDRAIIVEPAIMGDFGSTNWDYGRNKIVELLSKLGDNKEYVQFIFVVTNETLANIIREEMFGLGESRVKVILATAKFKLKFFVQLCTLELSELSDTYDSINTAKTIEETQVVHEVVEPIQVETPPERQEQVYDTGNELSDAPEFDDGTSFDESSLEENYEQPGDAGTQEFENPSNSVEESTLSDVETVEYTDKDEPDVVDTDGADFSALGTEEFETPESNVDTDTGLADKPEENWGQVDNTEEQFRQPEDAGTEEFADPENGAYNDNGLADKPEDTYKDEMADEMKEAFDDSMYSNTEESLAGTEEYEAPVENTTPVEEEVPVNTDAKPGESNDYFGGMYGESVGDSILSHMNDNDMQALQKLLATAANRRMSFVITGSKGSGKTTCAYNMAVLMAKLGYSTLYVDLDTETRGASYMDLRVYDWVHMDDDTISSLAHAIGNSANVISYAGIIMPGLHVLTLGLDQDIKPLNQVGTINRDKIHKFSSMIKENYNFIVYDVPFNQLDGCGVDLVYSADKLIYLTECSTRGLVSLMLDIANIGDDDLRQLVMKKAKVVLNKYYKTIKLFGKKIESASRIMAELDGIIYEVVGDDVDDRFEGMRILRTLPLNPETDNFWMTKKSFVETDNGVKMIGGLLKNILEA